MAGSFPFQAQSPSLEDGRNREQRSEETGRQNGLGKCIIDLSPMAGAKKGILITPESIRKGIKYFVVVLLLLVPTVLNLLDSARTETGKKRA